jgi:hypothetical protein
MLKDLVLTSDQIVANVIGQIAEYVVGVPDRVQAHPHVDDPLGHGRVIAAALI